MPSCDAVLAFRLDFLLTANNTVGNYWVSVHSQYRSAAVSLCLVYLPLLIIKYTHASGAPSLFTMSHDSVPLSLTAWMYRMLRMGAPSAYAVLNYVGAARSSFPSTPTPQPNVAPWSLSTFNNVGGGAGPGREGAACKEQIISGSSGSPLRGRNAETY